MENFSLITALNFQSGAKVTTCSEMFITHLINDKESHI